MEVPVTGIDHDGRRKLNPDSGAKLKNQGFIVTVPSQCFYVDRRIAQPGREVRPQDDLVTGIELEEPFHHERIHREIAALIVQPASLVQHPARERSPLIVQ
jgi:hypothetical protein